MSNTPSEQNFFAQMWEALRGLGSGEAAAGNLAVLVLQPDESAKASVAGFKSGASLRIGADSLGQTVAQILAKLNKYRGPDQQIRRIWTPAGEEIPGSMVPSGNLVGIVRALSV
jgi:hypothetical protein